MKTPYRIAKELEISPSRVYKRIAKLGKQLDEHITQNADNTMNVSDIGEQILKESFEKDKEQSNAQSIADNAVGNIEETIKTIMTEIINQDFIGNMEQTFDKVLKKNKEQDIERLQLENERLRIENDHLKEQFQNISGALAAITQKKKEPELIDQEIAPQPSKKNFFQRLFDKQ